MNRCSDVGKRLMAVPVYSYNWSLISVVEQRVGE